MAIVQISPFAAISNIEMIDFPYIESPDVMITPPQTPKNMIFKMTPQLAYINEAIINCRLIGIYKLLKDCKYDKVKLVIGDSIKMMQNAKEKDMDKRIFNKLINEFYHMTVEIALKKYNTVHDRVRDMHYYILCLYSEV